MAKSKAKATMTATLKRAIRESDVTLYRIAKDTGIVGSSLLRFMDGQTSLRLDVADKLAEYFGLELRATRGHSPRGNAIKGAKK